MSLNVTILGCGGSSGVPVIGCDCSVCTSDNPKNKRTRVSVLIEKGNSKLLIDASPDLRSQALRHNLKTIDALYITHDHADHCHGIDDIRSFNYHRNEAIPLYADAETMESLKTRFHYIFRPKPASTWFRACVEPTIAEANKPIKITDDTTILPYKQYHGKSFSYGVRVDNIAYSTDVNNFPVQSYQALENLDLWIVDCLQYEPAPTHAHLELTLEWIRQFKPKLAILTHLNHHMDYDILSAELPDNIEAAYDGMTIIIE